MTTAIAAAPALADQQPPPQPAPPSSKFLDYVNRPAPRQPTRLILYATEGWGKTSFAAMAPEPIFLLTRGETGLWTLINSGRLPGAVAHFPKPAEKWPDMFQALSLLIAQPHSFKSFRFFRPCRDSKHGPLLNPGLTSWATFCRPYRD